MTITRLQSVYTVVSDVNVSRDFYQSALGLKVKFQDGASWCQFDVGGSNFALSSVAEGPANIEGSVVVFEAQSLDEVASRVLAAGGTLLASRDMGGHGCVQTFADPDQRVFQVFSKSGRSS